MNLENRRILIVKQSSLGDIVHTLPAVHALKRCFPDCHIGWIVQDVFAGLLERDPAVDTVYSIHISSTSEPGASRFVHLRSCRETVAALRRLRRIFTSHPYDLILDLHASFRSGLLARTNPGGLRIGFQDARELNTLFQNRLVTVPEEVEHALAKNLLFCNHLDCEVLEEDFFMSCSNEDVAAVDAFIAEQGIAEDRVLLYANPAARWQTKFWPSGYWAELADRLYDHGEILLFGGSRQDKTYIESITGGMKTPPVVTAGRFTLPQSAALIQRSRLYVGLDSGPMHMAALSGIPVVALFGPTHPARVGPYGVAHRIVRAPGLDCLECRNRICDHNRCMRDISVQMVFEAARSLLEELRACPGSGKMGSVNPI